MTLTTRRIQHTYASLEHAARFDEERMEKDVTCIRANEQHARFRRVTFVVTRKIKLLQKCTTLRSVSGVPRADLPLAACRHRATQLTQNGRPTLTAEAESFSVFSAETRHGALPRSFRCTIRVWSIPRIEILIKYDVFREKYDTVWHGEIDGNVSRN